MPLTSSSDYNSYHTLLSAVPEYLQIRFSQPRSRYNRWYHIPGAFAMLDLVSRSIFPLMSTQGIVLCSKKCTFSRSRPKQLFSAKNSSVGRPVCSLVIMYLCPHITGIITPTSVSLTTLCALHGKPRPLEQLLKQCDTDQPPVNHLGPHSSNSHGLLLRVRLYQSMHNS